MSDRPFDLVQPGPCVACGATDYPLSMGGPGICPACDCNPPEKRVGQLAAENRALLDRLAATEHERDALMRDTWSAYALSGADTDGDEKWHCDPQQAGFSLVNAVAELRGDYNSALDGQHEDLADEVKAREVAERRCDQLRNALRRIAENGVCTISGVESKHQIFCPVHVARAALDAIDRDIDIPKPEDRPK